jgi:hypothetical protein
VAGSSETAAPTGTLSSDAALNFRLAEAGDGGADLDGAIQNMCYANALWTADQVNRHRWWGRVGGAVAVCHPLYTDKLTNEGSATANLTATGATVVSRIPRTVRPGCGGE